MKVTTMVCVFLLFLSGCANNFETRPYNESTDSQSIKGIRYYEPKLFKVTYSYTVLTDSERETLFSLLQDLKQYASVVLISHRLQEIVENSDRIVILTASLVALIGYPLEFLASAWYKNPSGACASIVPVVNIPIERSNKREPVKNFILYVVIVPVFKKSGHMNFRSSGSGKP